MSAADDDLGGFSLFDLFRSEAQQHAAALDEGLVALETAPRDPARLESLMRAAHSIKGAARIVGLDGAVRVAHAMEDVFVAAQKGKLVLGGEAVDALLAGADVLRAIGDCDEAAATAWLVEHAATLDALIVRLHGVEHGKPAVSAPGAAVPVPSSSVAVPTEGGPQQTQIPPPPPPVPSADSTPAPAAPPTRGAPTPDENQSVRVTGASLNRMLAFAGESVVEARRLASAAIAMETLRRTAGRLSAAAELATAAATAGGAASLVDSLAEIRAQAAETRALVTNQMDSIADASRRTEDLADRLYREVLASRMRPFGDGVGGYPRLVRDLAKDLGRRARLEIEGRAVLVDRDVLERLDAPIQHLLRNAVDHGIELPDARTAAGKDPEGQITLVARHRAGMLEVEVSDDGRGVDPERLRAKVVDRRLVGVEIAKNLSTEELLEFLFLPGFSTREDVTSVSGRGVGLDVVHTLAAEVGGIARAESDGPGRGARFTLVLPITRSVLRAAIVEAGGTPYAFPLTRIERLLRVEAKEFGSAEGRQFVMHEGRPVGVLPAVQALGLAGELAARDVFYVVLIAAGPTRYGLVVDRFLGEEDLVVRPLDARLGDVPNVSAASVREDGNPVLIIDVDDLVRSVDSLLHEGRLRTIRVTRAPGRAAATRKRILVVDDSITVREVERGLLKRHGYLVDTAVDGVDGWNAVRAADYALVVTDVDMPRMNGIELVRRIKQDERLRKLPVMIVSYKDREEDRQRGLEAGADAYIAKSRFQDEAWIHAVVDLAGEPGGAA